MIPREKGIIFVVSAPSGTGKTTICNKLVTECSNVSVSISSTSRPPREGEKQGIDYFFITETEFKNGIKQGKFAEWARVLGNYYGTERETLKKNIDGGKDVILSIDVKGAKAIKKCYPDSVLIFLLPPSFDELKYRLKKRGSETPSQLEGRLKLAKRELQEIDNYDYIVINTTLEQALNELKCIISSERCKVHRYNAKQIISSIEK